MISRLLVLAAALLGSGASASDAPTGRPADARAFGIGLGAGSASISVGDATNQDFSASIAGRIGLDSRNRFVLMAELYPVGVTNPVADETARSFGVLLGFNIGGTVKVRPSLGWSFNSWSGSQKVEAPGRCSACTWGPSSRQPEALALDRGRVSLHGDRDRGKRGRSHRSAGGRLVARVRTLTNWRDPLSRGRP